MTFRDIPGYEGMYQIDESGTLVSLRGKYPRVLKTKLGQDGYPAINLTINGKTHSWRIHKLVALTFIGPNPEGMEVRHLDNNPMNPNVDNLEYATHSVNLLDKRKFKTDHNATKTHCPQNHPYSGDNLYVRQRENWILRECRECGREAQKRSRDRNKKMVDSKYTHLAVVADHSGSMSGIAGDMNGGLEAFLKEQDALDGLLLVDITTFDGKVEQIITDGKVADVTFPVIVPRGMTALNDALGTTITSLGERFAKMDELSRPGKVIVLVITDGYENASREYKAEQIKELVTRQQDEWNWDFVFLGANIDSFAVGGSYGVRGGSTLNYTADAAGVATALRSASAYVTTSRLDGDATFNQVVTNPVASSS